MEHIEIVYLGASGLAVLAMIPQIMKLVKVKHSDALSLSTWSTWAVCQVVSLFYSISIGAIPLFIVNVAWIVFYIIMITLILKYRTKPLRLEYTPEMIEVAEHIKSRPVIREVFERDRL